MKSEAKYNFDRILPWLFTLIRIIIGWHFLYEGVSKDYCW